MDDTGTLVATLSELLISNYCTISTTVLFIYESAITFGDEVNLFWRRPITGATFLFISNRILVSVYLVYTLIISFVPLSQQSCSSSTILGYILDPIQYIPWAAFSAMRCFALSHHRLLSIFVFLLSIVPLAINLVVFHFDATGVEIPDIGCAVSDSLTLEMLQRLTIASRTCLMAADLILILVTWYRLSRNALQIRERATFAYVLLRDGTTYFIALFTLNALQLTLTLLSFHDPLQNASQVSFFTEPLTAILVSRMLINLQSVNDRATGADWTQQSGAHSVPLAFERVVGSLGASIPATMEDEGVEGEGDEHGEVGRATGVAV